MTKEQIKQAKQRTHNKLLDAVIRVIRSDGLDPSNKEQVKDSLSQCVLSSRLIKFYIDNFERVQSLEYV